MRSMNWLKLACLAAIVTVCAVAAVLIPVAAWTAASIVAVVLLALLAGGIFFFPAGTPRTNGSDAASLGSMGLISGLLGILIPWAASAVLVALSGHTTLAWSMNVLTLGGFVIGFSVLKAALAVIDKAGANSAGPGKRTTWISRLESLDTSRSDDILKSQIHSLVERLRYGASDIPGKAADESPGIDQGIESLALALHEDRTADAVGRVGALQVLIANRDAGLKAARSKA